MAKPIIAIKLRPHDYSGYVELGNRVVSGLTGNLAYTTPLPALASVSTQITAVENAIAAWGPKGNRGSHDDLVNLRFQTLTLANMLKSLAQYVMNTAQTTAESDYAHMAALITTSGFSLANVKTPQGVLEKVQKFHQFVSRKLNKNEVKLKWAKPLNVVISGNVKEYKVLRSNSTDFTTAVEVGIVTKTTFTDTNTSALAAKWTYWVIAYNTNGPGVVSDPVTVDVLGV